MTKGPIFAALTVLHLDDDPFELERVQRALEGHAIDCVFKVYSVKSVADFESQLGLVKPDVVILDVHVEDEQVTGISLATATRREAPGAVILMCSTVDDLPTIADCLTAGADDFISKNSDRGELSLRVYNSYRLAKLQQGGATPGDSTAPTTSRSAPKPVGQTMARIARRVPLIIDSAITAVFIAGESGTGKERVADLFGTTLPAGTPFIKINCGAITPTLLESELFGHVKGAFTGATTDKRGLFESASGGWLFLDEVATLRPSAQVALLRVLENQEVLRVGSTKPVPINVRILSATNEPMERLVRSGRFRADLWQRLREAEVELTPLRERPDEIAALVQHFCAIMPGGPYQISGPALEVLTHVSWKAGNIRELRNCLRAMTEMHVGRLLTPLAIPERLWDELGEPPAKTTAADEQGSDADHAPDGDGDRGESPQRPMGSARRVTQNGGKATINLPFDLDSPPHFEDLTDVLLLEVTRRLAGPGGRLSLRQLAEATGLSRSTVSTRLRRLAQKNLTTMTELSQLVGISEK